MLSACIYFLTAAAATSAGGLTGMGGGVIIKPVLDMLGDFPPAAIGVMSSFTVLVMSIVSTWKNFRNGVDIKVKTVVTVALGSVAGGLAGQKAFDILSSSLYSSIAIVMTQNIILLAVVTVILVYMKNKDHIRSKCLSGLVPVFFSGLALGVISSFLGIGGGPMNVALFIYLFSYNTKSAAACSLITILFAQISKLTLAAAVGDFAEVDWMLLIPMCVGAVAGGYIAGSISKHVTDRFVDRAFNVIQVVVMFICAVNIIGI